MNFQRRPEMNDNDDDSDNPNYELEDYINWAFSNLDPAEIFYAGILHQNLINPRFKLKRQIEQEL